AALQSLREAVLAIAQDAAAATRGGPARGFVVLTTGAGSPLTGAGRAALRGIVAGRGRRPRGLPGPPAGPPPPGGAARPPRRRRRERRRALAAAAGDPGAVGGVGAAGRRRHPPALSPAVGGGPA